MKCEAVQIVTPGRIVLDGLWYGPDKVKTAYIFVHGLSSTVFAHHEYLLPLVNQDTGVLFFSNRGHDQVTGIRKIDKRKRKGYTREPGGQALEDFTKCSDDISGAVNLVKSFQAEKIILVGHSTGSQKSVYFSSIRGNQRKIAGVVLMAPMSDYAAAVKNDTEGKMSRTEEIAKQMVIDGRGNELLPTEAEEGIISANRWLSLNTPDSAEEIFCYCQGGKKPFTLKKIRIPALVMLAHEDEYRDRPMYKIAKWFDRYMRKDKQRTVIIEGTGHGFDGKENEVADEINKWAGEI